MMILLFPVLYTNFITTTSSPVIVAMNGCRSDKALYSLSNLNEWITSKRFLNGPKCVIEGLPIPELVLADAGFSNDHNILCPFNQQGVKYTLSPKQTYYNRRISSCRVQVENAIGYLKNRFTVLKRKMHYSPDKMARIFTACCVLHNFVLACGEPVAYGTIEDSEMDMPVCPDSPLARSADYNPNLLIRNTLIEHFWRFKDVDFRE